MRLYTKEHTWVSVSENHFCVGITDYGLEQLGETYYFDSPAIGYIYASGEDFAEVESVKSAVAFTTPMAGECVWVCDDGDEDYPQMPLARFRRIDDSEPEGLMTKKEYGRWTSTL